MAQMITHSLQEGPHRCQPLLYTRPVICKAEIRIKSSFLLWRPGRDTSRLQCKTLILEWIHWLCSKMKAPKRAELRRRAMGTYSRAIDLYRLSEPVRKRSITQQVTWQRSSFFSSFNKNNGLGTNSNLWCLQITIQQVNFRLTITSNSLSTVNLLNQELKPLPIWVMTNSRSFTIITISSASQQACTAEVFPWWKLRGSTSLRTGTSTPLTFRRIQTTLTCRKHSPLSRSSILTSSPIRMRSYQKHWTLQANGLSVSTRARRTWIIRSPTCTRSIAVSYDLTPSQVFLLQLLDQFRADPWVTHWDREAEANRLFS